ncbi:FecR domain-containing protein [Roseospira goensis]|uniref:Ferric-dicitrate binding protein FerR (Iron transport regulator) n=1 Tax=Roseospira goensis TaxID=391922 RepID=A0A7W6S285_9PROT|nr:FecR domain-containing protein [Roseospira goensis]MBB4286839.1 ferric-dicitrate binding protein FerR (iron transport regulator) [Roseospira goensis]
MTKGARIGRRTALRLGGGLFAVAAGMIAAGPPRAATAAPDGIGADSIGHVTLFMGRASVIEDAFARPMQTGMRVRAGSHVVTGEGARASVRLDGGVVLTLGAATDLRIEAQTPDPDGWQGRATLRRGLVRIEFASGSQWAGFTVATRAATATCEGGHFLVESNGLLTTVYADDGRVMVRGTDAGDDGTVTVLGAGSGVDVARGQPPYAPTAWPASRATDMRLRASYP